jgi:hypothetical protein
MAKTIEATFMVPEHAIAYYSDGELFKFLYREGKGIHMKYRDRNGKKYELDNEFVFTI